MAHYSQLAAARRPNPEVEAGNSPVQGDQLGAVADRAGAAGRGRPGLPADGQQDRPRLRAGAAADTRQVHEIVRPRQVRVGPQHPADGHVVAPRISLGPLVEAQYHAIMHSVEAGGSGGRSAGHAGLGAARLRVHAREAAAVAEVEQPAAGIRVLRHRAPPPPQPRPVVAL